MSFEKLLKSLPSLRESAPIEAPFDAEKFLRWQCSTERTHDEMIAGRLVLSVWRDLDWVAVASEMQLEAPFAARRFCIVEAATSWDAQHCAALAGWLLEGNKFASRSL
jgi:hypothetical protein